jgi:CubicO group peptidase (beta-lactamase class C family)
VRSIFACGEKGARLDRERLRMRPKEMHRHILIHVVSFVILLCFSSCEDDGSAPLQSQPADDLDKIFQSAAQNQNLRSLIVYRDGQIVRQLYLHGGDALAAHDVRSVTKSVMATLIGIAIDKHIIASEGQPIGAYLQPLVSSLDSVRSTMPLSALLTMSAGFSGNELANASLYDTWFNAPNQVAYTLNKTIVATPGTVFNYDSGVAHLTSAVLTQATGGTTLAFANLYLFDPLGIASPAWQTDKQGIINGAAGVQLTPLDMLKLGQVYLNRGMYNGIRVVSEEWILKATSRKIRTNNAQPFGPEYGYFWWIGNVHSHDYFFANGWGGQFIVVVPDIKLIVVATNTWSGVPIATANAQWSSTLDLIMNRIIPLY